MSFFALIGKLLRSDEQAHFFLVGNAVVVAAMGALFAINMTTAERANGTLSLLLASPTRPVVVFASRGIYVTADGMPQRPPRALHRGAVVRLALPWPRILAVVPLTVVRRPLRLLLEHVPRGVIIRKSRGRGPRRQRDDRDADGACGVNVPVSFYPTWLAWSRAVSDHERDRGDRDVIDGAPSSTIAAHTGAELLVASVRSLALATFGRFMRAGQRDGSLEYAS